MEEKAKSLLKAALVVYLGRILKNFKESEDPVSTAEVEAFLASKVFEKIKTELGQNFVRYELAVAANAVKETVKNSALRNSTIGLTPKAKKILKENVLSRVTSIHDTTLERMKTVFAEIADKDGTLSDLKVALKDNFKGQISEGRLDSIAETEFFSAQSQGQHEAVKAIADEGHDVIQTWETQGDDKVRDSHAAVDGETRRPGEKFSNGLLHPHDPDADPSDTINCRCVLSISVSKKEEE